MKTIAYPNIGKFFGLILVVFLAFSGASYGQETKSPTVPPPPPGVKQPEFPKPPEVPKVDLSKPPEMKVPELPKPPEVKRPTPGFTMPARVDALEEKMHLLEERVKALEDAKK
jgi:hypothetical protein